MLWVIMGALVALWMISLIASGRGNLIRLQVLLIAATLVVLLVQVFTGGLNL